MRLCWTNLGELWLPSLHVLGKVIRTLLQELT